MKGVGKSSLSQPSAAGIVSVAVVYTCVAPASASESGELVIAVDAEFFMCTVKEPAATGRLLGRFSNSIDVIGDVRRKLREIALPIEDARGAGIVG